MNPLVLFHGECYDGFCAAWLMHRYFGEPCDFQAVYYNQPPPDVAGREVCILDFSYSRHILEDMYAKASSLMVLDHHASAQDELEGLPYCTFDMGLSGAQLTWNYLKGRGVADGPEPWLVSYTSDRDLWKWELPNSREVNAYIRSFPLEFSYWDDWVDFSPDGLSRECLSQGRAILRVETQMVNDHVSHAREVIFDGHKVLMVNATTLISEIAGALAKDRPFGVTWCERADGKWSYSLRSTPDGIDVSKIAKGHEGGGGHPRAAGFTEERWARTIFPDAT